MRVVGCARSWRDLRRENHRAGSQLRWSDADLHCHHRSKAMFLRPGDALAHNAKRTVRQAFYTGLNLDDPGPS